MNIRQTRKYVMVEAHKSAKRVREDYETYHQALSFGLKRAWQIVKLSKQWMEEENTCKYIPYGDLFASQEHLMQRDELNFLPLS